MWKFAPRPRIALNLHKGHRKQPRKATVTGRILILLLNPVIYREGKNRHINTKTRSQIPTKLGLPVFILWCCIYAGAAGQIWHWSLLGVKGLIFKPGELPGNMRSEEAFLGRTAEYVGVIVGTKQSDRKNVRHVRRGPNRFCGTRDLAYLTTRQLELVNLNSTIRTRQLGLLYYGKRDAGLREKIGRDAGYKENFGRDGGIADPHLGPLCQENEVSKPVRYCTGKERAKYTPLHTSWIVLTFSRRICKNRPVYASAFFLHRSLFRWRRVCLPSLSPPEGKNSEHCKHVTENTRLPYLQEGGLRG